MTTLARASAKRKFNSIGVEVIKWGRGCTEPAEMTHLSMDTEMGITNYRPGFS
jgi:hypothetical protein